MATIVIVLRTDDGQTEDEIVDEGAIARSRRAVVAGTAVAADTGNGAIVIVVARVSER